MLTSIDSLEYTESTSAYLFEYQGKMLFNIEKVLLKESKKKT